jgi:hypothetical protein
MVCAIGLSLMAHNGARKCAVIEGAYKVKSMAQSLRHCALFNGAQWRRCSLPSFGASRQWRTKSAKMQHNKRAADH